MINRRPFQGLRNIGYTDDVLSKLLVGRRMGESYGRRVRGNTVIAQPLTLLPTTRDEYLKIQEQRALHERELSAAPYFEPSGH